MKKVLLIEDDFSFALEVEMALTQDDQYTVDHASSGLDALALMNKNSYDAIVLDLYLRGPMNGIDLGNQIKDANIPIIVNTSHADDELYKLTKSFAPEAFLIKPYDRLTLIAALDSAFAKNKSDEALEKELLLRSNGRLKKIKIKDILYVNSHGNYSVIHSQHLSCSIKKSLKKVMEDLPDEKFIRIHKSYVVQIDLIKNVDLTNKVILMGEKEIPFGQKFKKELLARFA